MYTPTARLVTHSRFHETLHIEVQPMLKSIAIVAGSYVLSIILVLGTDPLLSRLLPGDFVKGRIPSNAALLASTAFFVVISILCAWICARFAPSRAGTHVLWFFIVGEVMASRRRFPTGAKDGRTGTGCRGC